MIARTLYAVTLWLLLLAGADAEPTARRSYLVPDHHAQESLAIIAASYRLTVTLDDTVLTVTGPASGLRKFNSVVREWDDLDLYHPGFSPAQPQ